MLRDFALVVSFVKRIDVNSADGVRFAPNAAHCARPGFSAHYPLVGGFEPNPRLFFPEGSSVQHHMLTLCDAVLA